jgi:hypothetical protein
MSVSLAAVTVVNRKENQKRTFYATLPARRRQCSPMGHRNPDRMSIVERQPGCETVDAMIEHCWKVRATCRGCRLAVDVDLFLVASVRGLQTSLWDRDAACRRHRCKGRMVFEAKAPGMLGFEPLAGQPVKREPGWKRGRA